MKDLYELHNPNNFNNILIRQRNECLKYYINNYFCENEEYHLLEETYNLKDNELFPTKGYKIIVNNTKTTEKLKDFLYNTNCFFRKEGLYEGGLRIVEGEKTTMYVVG